jgi:hypothetical protein
MGSLVGLLVGKSIFGQVISEKAARAMVIVGLFLLVLGVLGGIVLYIRKDAVNDHEAKIEHHAVQATNKAADERAKDTINNAKHEQELHDAIHAVPDAPPAGPSHALACKRLRDLGRHTAACG